MIVEWFIGIGAGLVEWFLSLFGTDDPPDWITDVGAFFADVSARISGLGAWVPLGLLVTVSLTLVGLWGALWIVKGIRWLWGLTPFSGGS